MANVNIQEDGVNLAEANTLNFNTPLLASVNTSTGIANIEASAIKITELGSAEQAVSQDLFVIVKNAFSFPVTENILVSDVFKNVSVNTTFNANVSSSSNLTITNNSVITVGNTTQNTILAYNYISVKNSVSNSANIEPGRIAIGNVALNASHISVGSNLNINVSAFNVGNAIANASLRGSSLRIEDSTNFINVAAGSVVIGNSTSNIAIDVESLTISNSSISFTLTGPSEEKSSAGNYYLNANGEWTVVETGVSTAGGSNTNIQFNNSNTLFGTNAFNFDSTTNTVSIQNNLFVGNSTANVFANATSFGVSNSTSNVSINSLRVSVGNTVVNSSLITISNSTSTANINPISIRFADVIVNSSSVSVGANAFQNFVGFNAVGSATEGNSTISATSLYIGNSVISSSVTKSGFTTGTSTSNSVINSSSFSVSNSTANIVITIPSASQISNGTFYLNANGSWAAINTTAVTTNPAGSNTQLQFNNSGAFGASDGLTFNLTTNTLNIANAVYLGNTTSNVFANNTVLKVGNAVSNVLANSSAIVLANSSSNTRIAIPTAATRSGNAFFLHANGDWINVATVVSLTPGLPAGSNTEVQFNDSGILGAIPGFVVNKNTNTVTISNTLIVANATSNTRLTIPTVSQYSGNAFFLHANGNWVNVETVIATTGIGAPGGANTEVQFNDSGVLSGISGFTINKNTNTVTISNTLIVANATSNTRLTVPTAAQYSGNAFFLHANGNWVNVETVITTTGIGSPGGANTQVQFNDSGVLNGTAAFTYNSTTNNVTMSNSLSIGTGSPVVISNNRIRGDFSTGSNASPSGYAQRVTFQSTTLAQTQVQAMPGNVSSSSRQSSFIAYNGDPSNSSFIATAAIPEYTFIESGKTASGTYLPLYVWTNNAPTYVFTNNNILGIAGATDRGAIVTLKYKNIGLYPFNGNYTWNMDVYGYSTSQNHFRIVNYDAGGNTHMAMVCSEPTGASLTPANTIFAPRTPSVAQIPFHLCVEGDFGPYADNAYDIGSSARAWRNIYSENALTVTSDVRYKSDIVDSNLGLAFINNLRPVSYQKKEEIKDLVVNELEDGTVESNYVSNETMPKVTHYGLIAQEVKNVLDNMGVDNFGGWVISDKEDEHSKQLLRYEEFISPMIKAIQELSNEVAALKEKINKLENE